MSATPDPLEILNRSAMLALFGRLEPPVLLAIPVWSDICYVEPVATPNGDIRAY